MSLWRRALLARAARYTAPETRSSRYTKPEIRYIRSEFEPRTIYATEPQTIYETRKSSLKPETPNVQPLPVSLRRRALLAMHGPLFEAVSFFREHLDDLRYFRVATDSGFGIRVLGYQPRVASCYLRRSRFSGDISTIFGFDARKPTRRPELENCNLKPGTQNPKPGTLRWSHSSGTIWATSESDNRYPKPGSRNSEPKFEAVAFFWTHLNDLRALSLDLKPSGL